MIKKTYDIVGFDCANCARKAEEHLAKNKAVASCRIDFSMNKLYVSFKDEELTNKQLEEIISEVETDPITISDKVNQNSRVVFTKKNLILMIRVIIAIIIMVICSTVFKDKEQYYWLQFSLYLIGIFIVSYDVFFNVINKIFHKENPIDEYLLISIAVIGAFIIASIDKQEGFIESLMVVTLFQVGRVIEGITTNKSKQAVMKAVNMRIDTANLVSNEGIKIITTDEINVGDILFINIGEEIPTDGVIVEGEGSIDTSSLTGEFIPVPVAIGNSVNSGTLLKEGSIKIKATTLYKDSTISKISELISSSGSKKSKADKFVTKFAKIYTPCVVIGALLFVIISGLITKNWSTSVYQGLKFLVIACPCAIVISVPLAYFSAIGLASKHGIVVKGANYLDELVNFKKLVTDKTGTLTHGAFQIQKIYAETTEEELLETLYIGESLSTHPIARAICHDINKRKYSAHIKNYKEETGKGISLKHNSDFISVGTYSYLSSLGIGFKQINEPGSIVYVSKNNRYLGYVILNDSIKKDAQPMVDLLHQKDIEILLLTGDRESNAKELCSSLGIDRWYSELLPDQKLEILEKEKASTKGTLAYIGDGINDAACIKASDVGIAMGGIGSDVSISSADIVIMNDDPAKVYDIYHVATIARNTAIFNIIFSLFIKISVVILCACIPNFEMTYAVLADTGLTVLMVINSLLVLYRPLKRKVR